MEYEYILDYSRIVFTKNNQPTKKATKKKIGFQNTFTNMISTIKIVADTRKTVIWMIFCLVENSLT